MSLENDIRIVSEICKTLSKYKVANPIGLSKYWNGDSKSIDQEMNAVNQKSGEATNMVPSQAMKSLSQKNPEYWETLGGHVLSPKFDRIQHIRCNHFSAAVVFLLKQYKDFESSYEVLRMGNFISQHYFVAFRRVSNSTLTDLTTWGTEAFYEDIWGAKQPKIGRSDAAADPVALASANKWIIDPVKDFGGKMAQMCAWSNPGTAFVQHPQSYDLLQSMIDQGIGGS